MKNSKRFLSILLAAMLSIAMFSVTYAQIYTGSLTLSTQAEVDAFNYTEVTASLDISGADITNLDSLRSLTSVGVNLDVSYNAALTNLDGLRNLTSVVGSLLLTGNDALTNLDGLSNLTSVGVSLGLYNNDALTNLDGLSSLTSVGGLGLTLYSNDALTNLDGLSSLTSVGGNLTVSDNAALTNLAGLSNLTSVGRDLGVLLNGAITNLDGLSSLTSVGGNLAVDRNAALTNLDGLSSLISVGGDLKVHTNAALTNLDGLSSLKSVEGYLEVSTNSALNNLDGLSSLTSVGGNIRVSTNAALKNLDGLSSLTSVGGDLIVNTNAALKNLDGLSSLTSVGGDLRVNTNAALKNLDGLSSLTFVGRYLYVTYNRALTNLDGLSSLKSVGERLFIDGNGALTNFDGLSSLTSVGGNLKVSANAVLTNLDGLSSLKSVGGNLKVSTNAVLTNLDGLSNLTSVGGNLIVESNVVLTSFCGLYSLLNAGFTGTYTVTGNAVNPSQQEIIDGGACPPPVEANISAMVADTIFCGQQFSVPVVVGDPNPVSDLFGVSFDLHYNQVHLTFINATPVDTTGAEANLLGANVLFLQQANSPGLVSIGISRTAGQTGVSGTGTVAWLNFAISDSVLEGTSLKFRLDNIDAIAVDGSLIKLSALEDSSIVGCGVVVWPGDTDNNGQVDASDILPIGQYYGETGPARKNADIAWTAQPAVKWGNSKATYADANGNGIIGVEDILPVGLNFGKTPPQSSITPKTAISAGKIMATVSEINGDIFTIAIETEEAPDLLGLAFDLTFEGANDSLEVLSIEAQPFMGQDIFFLTKTDIGAGKVSVGLSRKSVDGGVDGAGAVTVIQFKGLDSIADGTELRFGLKNVVANDSEGTPIIFDIQESTSLVTGIGAGAAGDNVPSIFSLSQNYPNPFNPTTTITFALPEASEINLAIYNLRGQLIQTLHFGVVAAGKHNIVWNGTDFHGAKVASGIYIYKLEGKGFVSSRKLALMK